MYVSDLGVVPVKGTRYLPVDAVELDRHGVVGDREFLVVAATDSRLLITGKNPALLRVRSCWDAGRAELRLEFPDGSTVTDQVVTGAPVTTGMYDGREVTGRVVDGPASQALSEFLDRPVHLMRTDRAAHTTDDAPVTIMSEASMASVAAEVGIEHLDPRRFRMTATVHGPQAWQEETWSGREIALGGSVLRVGRPVVRCVVTTRDPDTGQVDARVLHALRRLRSPTDLCFGMWCEIVSPGRVRRGDRLEV